MRTVKFRPLRIIKSTGKITVASYMQWRKVMTADYSKFNLIINDEHKKMASSDLVYNHKGEQLYFYNYNPADVPVFNHDANLGYGSEAEDILLPLEEIRNNNNQYGIYWGSGGHVNYHMKGADCDGVPTFSHFTANYIATYYKEMNDFEPLTGLDYF